LATVVSARDVAVSRSVPGPVGFHNLVIVLTCKVAAGWATAYRTEAE
jgi:hypothetical protein